MGGLTGYEGGAAGNLPPDKFETGTPSFEAMAGTLGAIQYFDWIGQTFGAAYAPQYQETFSGRRLALKQAMAAIEAYELELNHSLLEGLGSIPGLHIHGITSPHSLDRRVPTFSFTLDGWTPLALAQALAQQTINVWPPNFYALSVTERLGLEESGGLVRIGLPPSTTQPELVNLLPPLSQVPRS